VAPLFAGRGFFRVVELAIAVAIKTFEGLWALGPGFFGFGALGLVELAITVSVEALLKGLSRVLTFFARGAGFRALSLVELAVAIVIEASDHGGAAFGAFHLGRRAGGRGRFGVKSRTEE
jgi:hypothetical protein